MRTIKIALAAMIILSGNILFAQKSEVDTKFSNVTWLGKKVGSKHEGNIQIKSGYLELFNNKIVAGNFVADMTSITNTDIENEGYNKKLVGHLKSDDFFGVEKFPTAHFEVAQSSKFNNGKATITGDITIKGKTERISFETVKSGSQYSASIDIDRSIFDVRYGSDSFFDNLGDKAIDDIFTLDVKLVVN